MKKNIFNIAMLAVAAFTAVSCSPDFEGETAGNDGSPKATLYTYTPTSADGDYDADTDIRLRICGNNQTSSAYYEAIKTSEFEAMSETEVINKVVSEGKSVEKPADGKDVFITGLQGAWTLAVVATDGGSKVLSTTDFYGKTWNVVATGTVRTRFAAGNDSWSYGYIYNIELQQDQDNEDSYRLKNVFGKGVNLPISIISAEDNTNEDYDATGWADEGNDDYFGIAEPYRYVLMAKTATGLTYEGYGEVSVGDYYTVRGSDYTYYCRMYKDYTIRIYGYWTGTANMGTGWVYFTPDVD